MAKLEDIDAAALSRKYLGRPVVANRDVEAPDQSTEVGALLEAIAVAFLLYPQAALSFVLRAKNGLQQLVASEIELLDYMLATFQDLDNPDGPIGDTSDLVEAQTALLELDQLGRIDPTLQAYARYNAAVNRFLTKAGPFVKRHGRGELERARTEALQDLYNSLVNFLSLHPLVTTRLALVAGGVSNFNSIDLTRLVASRTLSRVRSSLSQVQKGMDANNLSKSVAVLELLAGSASLQSISKTLSVYDPTVDTAEKIPEGRSITAASEDVPASVLSGAGPWTLHGHAGPWYFCAAIDGGAQQNIQLPAPGVIDDRCYLLSAAPGHATYDTSGASKLYVIINGVEVVATLTVGAATPIATVATDITTALSGSGVTCVEAVAGSGRLLLIGDGTVTDLYVASVGRGSYSGGVFIPADPSAHAVLQFPVDKNGVRVWVGGAALTAADMTDLLSMHGLVVAQEDEHFRVSSPTARTGRVELPVDAGISYCVNDHLGFTPGVYPVVPGYLVLRENGTELDPVDLGVYVGSAVTAGGVDLGPVASIVDGRLGFGATPPIGTALAVVIYSPIVRVIQELMAALAPVVGTLDAYLLRVQTILTPVLVRNNLAAVNDAAAVLNELRGKLVILQGALAAAELATAQMKFDRVAQDIQLGLSERNLDLALDHLQQANFTAFFGLSPSTASVGGNMLLSTEVVGKTLLAPSYLDYDQDEARDVPAGRAINSDMEWETDEG